MDRNGFRMRGRTTVIAAAVMVSLAAAPAAEVAFAQDNAADLLVEAAQVVDAGSGMHDGADADAVAGEGLVSDTGVVAVSTGEAGIPAGIDGVASADSGANEAAAAVAASADAKAAESDAADDNQELSALNGWVERDGELYWYDDGVMAASKEAYDPESNAWYWFDADGTMARDKDVYLPLSNKWVRYDAEGHMVTGEDCRYGGWYFFDEVTGEMAKGVRLVEGGDGWKWVYYDYVTGQMAHSEA